MEQMNAAVEVTAGNQLFNVVVDNDGTSTTIIKYLNISQGRSRHFHAAQPHPGARHVMAAAAAAACLQEQGPTKGLLGRCSSSEVMAAA